ncbi:MAG: coiled-coil [Parcubacteria group bacterium GW2011_GWC1_40_13]|nr:MAG: coiled-coil [Parcubacteria group bacterium GW2011_GWC1_40_13]
MKKIIATAMLVSSLFVGGAVFAQSSQVALPSAGLTPESSFYFLDRLGENLRQFFTFNPEAKAKLQIEFAGERIAEIKIIVEKKGVNAKGLAIAESLLRANVAYAAEIVSEEKTSGKDVSTLAKTLNDEFDARDKLLEQTFKDAKAQLKAQRKEIKTNLLTEARRAGDTAQIAVLEAQLNDIDGQIDALGQKKDQLENSLQNEQEKIEDEMSENDQKEEEFEQKEEQEVEEAAETAEAEEADEPEEVDEPEEDVEQPEVEERDNKKDNSQNSSSSNQGDQNTTKAEDNE